MYKKKILFISNHASFFYSHRYNLFKESIERGYKFKLIFGNAASSKMEKFAIKKFDKEKIDYIKLNYSHNKFNLIFDILTIFQILKIVREFKPNIIHSASPKANFISSILALFAKFDKLILSISGLGYLFTRSSKSYLINLKKLIFCFIIRLSIKNQRKNVIVQNKDDYKIIKKEFKLSKKEVVLIEGGSGVNLNKYNNLKNNNNNKTVLMIARIVVNKGVNEFLNSARILKKNYPDWKFLIVGGLDYKSPDSININYLNELRKKNIISIHDYKSNVLKFYENAEIFCLPSYREGMPKTVLEASSCGLPVVTTDAIGCRDSIINNFSGLLCKPYNHIDLANKIEILIKDKKLRKKLGKNGKIYAKSNFAINKITNKIFNLYK
jgi:glycosyltransferase involved in cell wall biosynthesis